MVSTLRMPFSYYYPILPLHLPKPQYSIFAPHPHSFSHPSMVAWDLFGTFVVPYSWHYPCGGRRYHGFYLLFPPLRSLGVTLAPPPHLFLSLVFYCIFFFWWWTDNDVIFRYHLCSQLPQKEITTKILFIWKYPRDTIRVPTNIRYCFAMSTYSWTLLLLFLKIPIPRLFT